MAVLLLTHSSPVRKSQIRLSFPAWSLVMRPKNGVTENSKMLLYIQQTWGSFCLWWHLQVVQNKTVCVRAGGGWRWWYSAFFEFWSCVCGCVCACVCVCAHLTEKGLRVSIELTTAGNTAWAVCVCFTAAGKPILSEISGSTWHKGACSPPSPCQIPSSMWVFFPLTALLAVPCQACYPQ